jgi:hypothetical protein
MSPNPERPSRRTYSRRAVLAAAAVCLLLAGCGGKTLADFDIGFGGSAQHSSANDWIKPGAQPGEGASAYSDCSSIARQATQKDADIDQDIAATRGADLQHSQIVQMRTSQQRGVTTQDADSILASCMQQKGFVERR